MEIRKQSEVNGADHSSRVEWAGVFLWKDIERSFCRQACLRFGRHRIRSGFQSLWQEKGEAMLDMEWRRKWIHKANEGSWQRRKWHQLPIRRV